MANVRILNVKDVLNFFISLNELKEFHKYFQKYNSLILVRNAVNIL